MKKLNLGIIGCGDIAFYTALLSIPVPRIKLTACCDTDQDRLASFARKFRIKQQFSDYRNLLQSDQVEAVYLSIPHHLHYEMILAALEAGKPVFVEKPLTRTLDEGIQLSSQLGNFKVGVNYQYRYNRGCFSLARAAQSGQLGRISSVRINIPWHRTQTYFDNAPWHKTVKQAGGGTLITQGSHALDIALWALNEPAISAMGYTSNLGFDVEVDTVTHGIIETQSGTFINIASSMIAAKEQAVTLDFYGDKSTVLFTKDSLPALRIRGGHIKRQLPNARGLIPMQRSLVGFANWVLDDIPYLTPAASALPVLAAVDGIYRSAVSGKRESIKSLHA